MNMDNWVVDTLNELFLTGFHIKIKKKKSSKKKKKKLKKMCQNYLGSFFSLLTDCLNIGFQ